MRAKTRRRAGASQRQRAFRASFPAAAGARVPRAQHPEVTLDIVLTDEVVDILEQRTDVAVRAGPLKSSSLVARKLGSTRMLIVGAPALARHGMPAAARWEHNRLGANYVRTRSGWPLRDAGENSWCRCRAGQRWRGALSGRGRPGPGAAGRVPGAREDIAAGRLIPVLEAYNPGDLEEVHAVYVGQGVSAAARAGVPGLSGGARRYEPGLIAVLHEYADSAAESFSS